MADLLVFFPRMEPSCDILRRAPKYHYNDEHRETRIKKDDYEPSEGILQTLMILYLDQLLRIIFKQQL